MKTVVLVHSEMDYSEDDVDNPTKMVKGNHGPTRRCVCDCCKKMGNVNELIRRLGELIQEQK